MAVNGDVSDRPSPAKRRGVFVVGGMAQGTSGSVRAAKPGVIYVLESVLRCQVFFLNHFWLSLLPYLMLPFFVL